MRKGLLGLALFLTLGLSATADEALNKAILEKEAAFRQTMISADDASMEKMLGEDFYAIWPDGEHTDKDGQLNVVKTRWRVTKVEPIDLKVRTFNDDTAIVTGRLDFIGTWDGKAIDHPRRFTHVWVKDGKDWKMISRHLSTIGK